MGSSWCWAPAKTTSLLSFSVLSACLSHFRSLRLCFSKTQPKSVGIWDKCWTPTLGTTSGSEPTRIKSQELQLTKDISKPDAFHERLAYILSCVSLLLVQWHLSSSCAPGILEAPIGLWSSGQSSIWSLTLLAPVAGTHSPQDNVAFQKCRSCKTQLGCTCPQFLGNWVLWGLPWASHRSSNNTTQALYLQDMISISSPLTFVLLTLRENSWDFS